MKIIGEIVFGGDQTRGSTTKTAAGKTDTRWPTILVSVEEITEIKKKEAASADVNKLRRSVSYPVKLQARKMK